MLIGQALPPQGRTDWRNIMVERFWQPFGRAPVYACRPPSATKIKLQLRPTGGRQASGIRPGMRSLFTPRGTSLERDLQVHFPAIREFDDLELPGQIQRLVHCHCAKQDGLLSGCLWDDSGGN